MPAITHDIETTLEEIKNLEPVPAIGALATRIEVEIADAAGGTQPGRRDMVRNIILLASEIQKQSLQFLELDEQLRQEAR
jgi:hypothetical protein